MHRCEPIGCLSRLAGGRCCRRLPVHWLAGLGRLGCWGQLRQGLRLWLRIRRRGLGLLMRNRRRGLLHGWRWPVGCRQQLVFRDVDPASNHT